MLYKQIPIAGQQQQTTAKIAINQPLPRDANIYVNNPVSIPPLPGAYKPLSSFLQINVKNTNGSDVDHIDMELTLLVTVSKLSHLHDLLFVFYQESDENAQFTANNTLQIISWSNAGIDSFTYWVTGRTNHLTTFAILLDGSTGGDDDDVDKVIPFLALAFVALAIIIVLLSIVLIELKVRRARAQLEKELKQATSLSVDK